MTKAELHHLLDELPENAVNGAALFLTAICHGDIDPDQAWFWTPEWQAGEREVDEALARGERGEIFYSSAEFLASLQTDS
ncbi:MAG: hypothetical protein ACREP9_00205 [Candidatus Dormibacteraceae bacterium]